MSQVIATRWYTLSDGSCIGVVAVHTNEHEPDAPYKWEAYIGHALGLSHTSDEQQIAALGMQLSAIEAHAYFPSLALERYKDDEGRTSKALAETTQRALEFVAALESRLKYVRSDQAYMGITRTDVRLLRTAISDQATEQANERWLKLTKEDYQLIIDALEYPGLPRTPSAAIQAMLEEMKDKLNGGN